MKAIVFVLRTGMWVAKSEFKVSKFNYVLVTHVCVLGNYIFYGQQKLLQ